MPRHIDALTLALLAKQHPTVGIFVEMMASQKKDRSPLNATIISRGFDQTTAKFVPTDVRGYGFVICAQCAAGCVVHHGRIATMVREHDTLFAAWGVELDRPCMMCSTEMTTCPTLSSTS